MRFLPFLKPNISWANDILPYHILKLCWYLYACDEFKVLICRHISTKAYSSCVMSRYNIHMQKRFLPHSHAHVCTHKHKHIHMCRHVSTRVFCLSCVCSHHHTRYRTNLSCTSEIKFNGAPRYTYIHIHMHINIHMHIHIRIHIHIHIHIHMNMNIYIFVYIYIYIYIHIYTSKIYTYICMHICIHI